MQAIPIPGHEDIVTVVFHWSTEHGTCHDCGLPAAYEVKIYGPNEPPAKLCSVCTAWNAYHNLDGAGITPLFPDA